MKTRLEIICSTSCAALIAVTLSTTVFAGVFTRLDGVTQLPPEAECYAMADGRYQRKSPKANEPIMMQCDKSVRLPKVVKLSDVAKNHPNECGIYVPDGQNYAK